jgi:phosphopantothenoylcysteine decarboxylase/phosphopantothenate--cysteine ligase
VTVLEPDDGPLTSGDSGRGRLPEPTAIADAAYALLRPLTGDRAGRHLVVSAGGTREALDPVRFLGNRSSGRQGWAIARAALARGARVTLVAANVAAEPDLADPPGAQVVRVGDTAELRAAVLAAADAGADVIVMAAAVADFRPATGAVGKLKKPADGSGLTLELVQNPDVLAELGAADRRGRFPHQVLVGFAAETDPDQGAARAKLARKGADLLVLNEVGPGLGFEVATNAAVVLDRDGGSVTIGRTDKLTLAHRVLDRVVPRLS